MRASIRYLTALAALLLVACGGATTSGSSSPTPSTATPTAQPSATPVALDPCQLVTSSEASSIAGASFKAGKEDTTSGGSKTCTYGAQTRNVFLVVVTQAPDAATAQADWAQEQAKAEAAIQKDLPQGASVNLNASDVSNVPGADRAAIASFNTTISGQPVGVIAIYLLKGSTFVTFSDLVLGTPPTAATMEAQAQTTLGRIP